MDQESKTEKATDKRRQEQRRKGNIAKTPELAPAFILLASFVLISFAGNRFIQNLSDFMVQMFNFTPDLFISFDYLQSVFYQSMLVFAKTAGFFLLCSAVLGLTAGILQAGFIFSFEHLKDGFSKLNPITGLKKFFSLEIFVSLLKNILKASIVSFVLYNLIKSNVAEIILFSGREPAYISGRIVSFVYQLGLRISFVLILVALFDYFFQKNRYEKKIMMSRYEVRQELKQQEGDPLYKSWRKSKHLAFARAKMMQELPNADVVVTNPTTYAVALQYRADYNAPRVIAKGMRLMAERIKETALKNEIPVIENVFVAQTLYKSCEVGQEVPPELYKAVAEILAYVYKIKENFQEKNYRGYGLI